MTISYPLDLNALVSEIGIARFSIETERAQFEDRNPFTFASQVQDWLGDLLILDVSFPALDKNSFLKVRKFLLQLRGIEGTFIFGDPTRGKPKGKADGIPVCWGDSTGTYLHTRGWIQNSIDNVLEAGDLVQIGLRTYEIVEGGATDGFGNAEFEIFPRLREIPADGASVILLNCKSLWRLRNPQVKFEVAKTGLYYTSISAIEAL